jgi:hypothetical protein
MRRLPSGSSASPPIRDRSWLVPLSLALALMSGHALANGLPRVALVTTDPTSTTATRLGAELRGLGVEVVVVPVEETRPLGRAALEQLARTDGAFAAVRVIRAGQEVEVWIADRVTGKTVVREVHAGTGDPGSRDDTIAVGTVELLRASLLEVTVEPETPHGEVPPPAVVTRLVEVPRKPLAQLTRTPERPVFGLSLGPALDAGLGAPGFGPSLGLEVGARWQSETAWGLEALGAMPLRSVTVERDKPGSAELRLYRAALGATWSVTGRPVVPVVGLGLALVRLESAQVRPNPDYQTETADAWAVAPRLSGGLGVELGRYLRLRGDVGLLVAPRPVTVRLPRASGGLEEVARWGQPGVTASLALEVSIPRAPASGSRAMATRR